MPLKALFLVFYATLSQSERSSPCSRDKARTVTSRHTRDVNKVKFGCPDHVSTTCNPVFSIGNCFDQIEPSRSATERSGVRFRNYTESNMTKGCDEAETKPQCCLMLTHPIIFFSLEPMSVGNGIFRI